MKFSRSSLPTTLIIVIAMGAVTATPVSALGPTIAAIEQLSGFPIVLEAEDFGQMPFNLGGVVLADLNGDGHAELVYSYQRSFPPSAEEGFVAVWDQSGSELPGFPLQLSGGTLFAPSVGDLDNDGTLEIVQVTLNPENEAHILVVEHDGTIRPGFPVAVGSSWFPMGPTLADLDQDQELEMIFQSDSALWVVEADGSLWSGSWPLGMGFFALGPPMVGDVTGDGSPEIFVADHAVLHLLDVSGNELAGWPQAIAGHDFAVRAPGALADLDHDGDLEIVIPSWFGEDYLNMTTRIHVFHHDGTAFAGWPQADAVAKTECPPIVTDLEGDGELEILIGSEIEVEHLRDDGTAYTTHNPLIAAWDSNGQLKAGFPWIGEDNAFGVTMLTAADVDGDGRMEIFSDASMHSFEEGGYIFAIDADGKALEGFPLRPHGATWDNGAVLADVDGDGDLELGAVSFYDAVDEFAVHINLFDLAGNHRRSSVAWPTYHSSNHRGGLCGTQQIIPTRGGRERGPRWGDS